MKVNYKNNIETVRFKDVAVGSVFFFVDEIYESDKEGYLFGACGPFLKVILEDNNAYLAVSLDYGIAIADVSFDSEVYFPKKAELNIEK